MGFLRRTIFVVIYYQQISPDSLSPGLHNHISAVNLSSNNYQGTVRSVPIEQMTDGKELQVITIQNVLGGPTVFYKNTCLPLHGKVALLQLASGDDFIKRVAWNALQSVRCYSRMRRYALYQFTMIGNHLISGAETEEMKHLDSVCEFYNSLLPKRHCLAAQLLLKYDYVVHIDADSGVVNPNHCFEEYIVPGVDLHFLLRVHSGEVQAGHYIAKNTSLARDFLMKWAQNTKEIGQFNDQPVLHDLLSKILLTSEEKKQCTTIKTKGYYIWIKCILGKLRNREKMTQKALFYARAQAFVRDGWSSQFYWSNVDFMLHAMKHDNDRLFLQKLKAEECKDNSWSIPYDRKLVVSDENMKKIWKEREELFQRIYPHFARLQTIADCWPHCKNLIA